MPFVATIKLIPEAPDADLFDTILTADGKGAKFKEAVLAEMLKRATTPDEFEYWYTYKLPLTRKTVFDHWKVKSVDEARDLAFSKYKTVDFFLDQSDRPSYFASTVAKRFAELPRAD